MKTGVICLEVFFCGGDFRQVLPVMPHASREDIVGHSIKPHRLWTEGYVSVHPLATNMPAREDGVAKILVEHR